MPKGPTRVGRPLAVVGSEGQVRDGDCGRVPDDAAHVVVAVIGFDVPDRVALSGESGVVVVCVDVRGDGAVLRDVSCRCSRSASARLLMAAGMPGFVTAQPPRREDRSHAQPRAGASSRRAWRAWRGPDWSGRAAAPEAGLNRRDLPGIRLADQQASFFARWTLAPAVLPVWRCFKARRVQLPGGRLQRVSAAPRHAWSSEVGGPSSSLCYPNGRCSPTPQGRFEERRSRSRPVGPEGARSAGCLTAPWMGRFIQGSAAVGRQSDRAVRSRPHRPGCRYR